MEVAASGWAGTIFDTSGKYSSGERSSAEWLSPVRRESATANVSGSDPRSMARVPGRNPIRSADPQRSRAPCELRIRVRQQGCGADQAERLGMYSRSYKV